MLQVYKDMKENKTPEWGRKPEWRVMGRVVMDAGNIGACCYRLFFLVELQCFTQRKMVGALLCIC